MKISFADDKLEKIFNSRRLLQKHFGDQRARHIERRLAQLSAADNLEIMRTAPGHCHELKGTLAGLLAVSLDGPYRLLFTVAHEPIPRRPDGALDWTKVTAIRIVEVVDYHE